MNKLMNNYRTAPEGNSGHREDHEDAPAACGEVPAQERQSGRVRNKLNYMFMICFHFDNQDAEENWSISGICNHLLNHLQNYWHRFRKKMHLFDILT